MILNPPTGLHMLDWDMLARLSSAAVLGLLLGVDRELRDMPAGMRTHGLICFSAAFVTVAALALYYQMGGLESNIDPLRVIEGTAAFTGIIAAGLIVVNKGEVKHLTTAAHVWLATVIGIACGAGLWPLVAFGAIVAVIMLTLLGVFEKRVLRQFRAERAPDDKIEDRAETPSPQIKKGRDIP
ncbi:MgtC/SapB family protein [Altererythrobacter xixiisoli]|uniref:Protein MgtC n=1 Tax=Croceibacterium xixiisoli TaxID=1476466 RepID=A0A6I4TWL9_9SPHN|nr:MgtC/SapB family protein [Croceibacterium xixiisoli]MXO99609.1 MgtC/SapB family protein [Croceibacterium xixiisoli]